MQTIQTEELTIFEQVAKILDGIDAEECEREDGWWETSYGAAFGAGKLEELRTLLENVK